MSQEIMKLAEKKYKSDRTMDFGSGDTINVSYKIQEGNKTRIQSYQGTVIAQSGSGMGETFMVRKVSSNSVYVERVFALHSPLITEIKLLKRGKVRRAKLFYLRGKTGKATRIEELRGK